MKLVNEEEDFSVVLLLDQELEAEDKCKDNKNIEEVT